MDNYFQDCPPMMDDGRLFTDYRSSQVREEIFKYRNRVISENEARTLRIENGENIIDSDWDMTRKTKSCFPRRQCFHKQPMTHVSSSYNNAELLAYNGVISAPVCEIDCHDYKMTSTKGSAQPKPGCNPNIRGYEGYDITRQPVVCPRSGRIIPERLRQD